MKTKLILSGALAFMTLAGCSPDKETTEEYSVKVTAGEGGSARATVDGAMATKAAAGTRVILEATEEEGFEFTGWTLTGATMVDDSANPASFTMPEGDVTVEAGFKALPAARYDITVTQAEGGTVEVSADGELVETAAAGTGITITAIPAEGYLFTGWNSEGVTFDDPTENPVTFTMPEGSVTIGALFTQRRYSITLGEVTNGTVAATVGGEPVSEAFAGTRITITAVAGDAYELVKWTLTGATPADETSPSTTFTMPVGDVTVAAEFRLIPQYNITVVQSIGGNLTASATTALPGTVISIAAVADNGCDFVKWVLTGAEPGSVSGANTTFTMPHNDVTVSGLFRFPIEGVLINGIVWAPVNVDMPGVFAYMPQDAGMFYQWNRKTAWTVTGQAIAYGENGEATGEAWREVNDTGTAWIPENDPCPTGWRLPTGDEIKTLFDATNVSAVWETTPAVGARYTNVATGASVFFPASGCRADAGWPMNVGVRSMFWASTTGGSIVYAATLTVRDGLLNAAPGQERFYGLSVRCVEQ